MRAAAHNSSCRKLGYRISLSPKEADNAREKALVFRLAALAHAVLALSDFQLFELDSMISAKGNPASVCPLFVPARPG